MTAFFDPQYYANMNCDLLGANLLTYAQLESHWLVYGINEGRSPHPYIDPRSYLARYPDLRAAFGPTNYRAAFNHFVTNGYFEGRNGRSSTLLSAQLGGVSIAASPRSSGALDSLFFNGIETVNAIDHGRQVQTALYDKQYDACFNPTQAGRRSDGRGYPSSSQLLSAVKLSASSFRTKTRCAYWVGPGETITDAGIVPCTAGNLSSVLSGFTCDTTYTLSAYRNVTLLNVHTEWVGDIVLLAGRAQVVPMTGYHRSMLSFGVEVVPENGYAARVRQIGDHLGNIGQERPWPTIFSTPDGATAIGAWCRPVTGAATTYALYRWKYGQNQETNDSSSWAVVNRYVDAVPAGTPMVADTVIALGQVTDVHLALRDLIIESRT